MPHPQKSYKDSPSMADVSAKDAGNGLLVLAKFGSMAWSPFFSMGAGDRYYQFAIVTLFAMLAFVQEVPPLLAFIPAWLLCVVATKTNKSWHSQSRGPSRLRVIFRNDRLALVMEPFAVFGLGIAVAPLSDRFALFCFFGAVCLFVELAVRVHYADQTRRRIRDGEAQMAYMNDLRRGNSIF